TQRSRAVLVVHPNNPTGSMLRETEARELAAFCAERGLAVISDEVFADFPFGEGVPAGTPRSLLGIVGRMALVFCLGGLSKAAGLPQLKLSWILADGPAAEREEALARLEILGDTFLSVGTPVQAGVDALFGAGRAVRDTIRARVRANRAHLEAAASVPGCCWEVLAADGGWYAVVRVPRILTDEQWAMRLLEDERVYVHPGYLFDFPGEGYLVLSLLPPEETFRAAAGRMADRIAREATGEQPR
ncbi:MAG: pyridoxal phosphate-dependent aminotransferase, partial [Candidatus Eisenbacteria bacterium]|nr:pyridoxal phosphate-dependent aminotransferase [Candidatus Eisenbacteria bacterium]